MSLGRDCIASCQIVFEKDSGSISIGDRTFIGGGRLICIDQITIGNDVLISWGCTIMDNDAHSIDWENRKNDLIDWKKGWVIIISEEINNKTLKFKLGPQSLNLDYVKALVFGITENNLTFISEGTDFLIGNLNKYNGFC